MDLARYPHARLVWVARMPAYTSTHTPTLPHACPSAHPYTLHGRPAGTLTRLLTASPPRYSNGSRKILLP